MTDPEPTICVDVDPSNPGQFFASCGLLELADRLWPESEAEGCFAGGQFVIAAGGGLPELLTRLGQAGLASSLTDAELKRLGTLMSIAKTKFKAGDAEALQRLNFLWKRERLHLSVPFDFGIDWWHDTRGERTDLKTWAAKQLVTEIARPMLRAVGRETWTDENSPGCLTWSVPTGGLPFNFDSDLAGFGSAIDAGFSFDAHGFTAPFRPLLELAAFIGLQRSRPGPIGDSGLHRFGLWTAPLLASGAAAVASSLGPTAGPVFEFRVYARSEYMKVFLPAQLSRGDVR